MQIRKSKNSINLSVAAAILSLLILPTTACLEQKASTLPKPSAHTENKENIASANPQIEAAREMIEKSPASPAAYNRLASAYIRLARENGDFSLNSKADEAVNRALAIQPDDLNALKLKTSLHLTFHRFPEALELAAGLIKENPNDAFLYGALTDADVELGNYEEAVKNVQKMVDLRPNMSSYARVSHVRSLYGDTEGAIEAMRIAAKIADPDDREAQAWCYVHLGNEFYKAGQYRPAEIQYETALKIFPDYYFALAGKGQARAAAGDYEMAVRFLKQAQDRVPLTETIIALGDLYQKTGDSDKAREQFTLVEIIEQKLGVTNDQRRLALFWADHDLKLDEALEAVSREHAIRRDVYTADIFAWCLYKKERFQEAKTAILEALRLKNKDARVFYHAGLIEKALGHKKEAAKYLELALKTNPAFDLLQSEKAKTALRELK